MVTHSATMLEKHLVYAGETPSRNFTTARVKKRSIKPEDPMSHRIIEKRRRDRMNNCLADLSRLIPPEYLKKGRGRIEKTEIIEMAIKHMRHLQNIIASSRFNEISDNSMPSPPAATSREPASVPGEQPIIIEHYRLGYLECLSEAMHFLVEVQGYFAGDSLCVQMINHLHKHCDKILKGNTLNFPKKHGGETGSDPSTSPANGTFNNSPPLAMSNSTGSASDDNQPVMTFEPVNPCRRYSDGSYTKKSSENCYPRYLAPEEFDADRSDSELHQNFGLKCRNGEVKKDESKVYLNAYETAVSFGGRSYQPYPEESLGFDSVSMKDETGNGPSQLREMLTSPSSFSAQLNGHSNKLATEVKGNTSPLSNASGCESSSGGHCKMPGGKKTQDANEGSPDLTEIPPDNHHMMYKFKNNIKQRFSKEKRENSEEEAPQKKQKQIEEPLKFPDPLMKERLNLLDRTDPEEDKAFKFGADFETKKRIRYSSESEIHDGDISNRLSFGHKSTEKGGRRWEDAVPGLRPHNNPKLWTLSPNGSVTFFGPQACKPPGRLLEYPPAASNSLGNLPLGPGETGPGIPIFALHAKGSFYIPLTLDHATLAPFLALLGVTKTDEEVREKTVLHPVTISVNFQSHLVR